MIVWMSYSMSLDVKHWLKKVRFQAFKEIGSGTEVSQNNALHSSTFEDMKLQFGS